MKDTKKMKSLLDCIENMKGESNLRDDVLDIIINYIEDYESFEDVRSFIEDVRSYGCVNGMVGELIYYDDIKRFYINNLDEIQDYINNLINEGIYSINELNYNEIVWATFESIANEYFYIIENEMDNIEANEDEEL